MTIVPPARRTQYYNLVNDEQQSRELVIGRLWWAAIIMLAVLLIILARYWYLQIPQHDEFVARSDNNRIRLRALPPTRGIIYDRNGVVVADNRPAYRLEIIRERLTAPLEDVLADLSTRLELNEAVLQGFQQRLNQHRRFEPVVLRYNLSEQEIARVAVDLYRLPGVEISPYLTRYYPFTTLLAHAVGYVGRLSAADLQRVDTDDYRATTHIGKIGLEKYYEDRLHGQSGFEQVETNAAGRVVNVLNRQAPLPGENLHLTLDVRLQRAAALALGNSPGAVVAMHPASGEILAMVSNPSYDPNLFINGISQRDYQQLLETPNRPLFNRALQGGYEPGSTMKPFVALLGLQLGLVHPQQVFQSTGEFFLEGSTRAYRDWLPGGHGYVTVRQALEQSVNTVFYQLALELGIDRMHTGLKQFGFGQTTGIDLEGEAAGILPSRDWKRQRFGEPWYPGETVISGIGQGFHVTTPLQLVMATALLATQGEAGLPHLAKDHATSVYKVDNYDQPYWHLVERGMRDVIHGASGSARAVVNNDYWLAGKTGTAQVFSRQEGEEIDTTQLSQSLQNHALFIAYGPLPDPAAKDIEFNADLIGPFPQIAVVAIIEHGGSGSRAAAPVAAAVIEAWAGLHQSSPQSL